MFPYAGLARSDVKILPIVLRGLLCGCMMLNPCDASTSQMSSCSCGQYSMNDISSHSRNPLPIYLAIIWSLTMTFITQEKSQIQFDVISALSKAKYACSTLGIRSGYTANFLYRGKLHQVLANGEDTIVFKHVKSCVAVNKEFAMDERRCVGWPPWRVNWKRMIFPAMWIESHIRTGIILQFSGTHWMGLRNTKLPCSKHWEYSSLHCAMNASLLECHDCITLIPRWILKSCRIWGRFVDLKTAHVLSIDPISSISARSISLGYTIDSCFTDFTHGLLLRSKPLCTKK